MLDLLRDHIPGRILDIGCGTGVVSGMLKESGWEVYGLDISKEGIKKYCGRGFCGLVTDAEKDFPFRAGVFDAVWVSEVIEHLVDYRRLVAEIRRVLKDSGKIYVTTPNSVFFGYRLLYLLGKCPTELQHPYHVRFFSPRYLAEALTGNGFVVEETVGQNVYLMVPGAAVRFLDRLGESFSTRVLTAMGFRPVQGLIRGDKWLYYRFSSFFPSLFSNVIMMVGRKAED